jgi:hypothetical protein
VVVLSKTLSGGCLFVYLFSKDQILCNYKVDRQRKLVKKLKYFLKLIKPEIIAQYGSDQYYKILTETVEEYKSLIPQFPYIGGKENRLTSNLVQSCWGLALYRVLQNHGETVEQTGDLLVIGFSRMMDKLPAFLRKIMGKMMFSDKTIAKWNIQKGDGEAYDVAIDYTECGIQKFVYSQGAKELVPYLCRLDYVLFDKLGMKLVRTKTLADGFDCCDFRIRR